jgi:hypothetical protein
MPDLTTLLVWGFGISVATIMFGSIVKKRRENLVGLLRAHVEREIGPPPGSDPTPEGDGSQAKEENE